MLWLDLYVSNFSAFSGGTDTHTFAYVQQSDIDGAATTMSASLTAQATSALDQEVNTDEKLSAKPTCAPDILSNVPAGTAVAQVSVTVNVTCLGEVYDATAATLLASSQLDQDAASQPGTSYSNVGSIQTSISQITPQSNGSLLLQVHAQGIWVYQFTSTQRAALAQLIAGKNSQDARSILLHQPGVSAVLITLTGAGTTIVPGDVKRIMVRVEAVQGLK